MPVKNDAAVPFTLKAWQNGQLVLCCPACLLCSCPWYVLMCLMPSMMLLMMHRPPLHQPWRLHRCNPFTHSLHLPGRPGRTGTPAAASR